MVTDVVPAEDVEGRSHLTFDTTGEHELEYQGGIAEIKQPNDRIHQDKPVASNSYPSKLQRSPDTPSARTGPPRSLSYNFSFSRSHGLPRSSSNPENVEVLESDQGSEFPFALMPGDSNFRGALDYDKKGKKRETMPSEDTWNLIGRFHESPLEEQGGFDFKIGVKGKEDEHELCNSKSNTREMSSPLPLPPKTRRSFSVPHMSKDGIKSGAAKWGLLRSLFPTLRSHTLAAPASAVTSHTVNITDELITGGLSTLMLRLWFERDEKDHRRIPVLFHRLRIRVSDSLHPLHGHKSVFRIECEYANGAARWVIYRQLRDFISLHTHYTLSNAYNRNVNKLPEFPRTSAYVQSMLSSPSLLIQAIGLPYFKFLKKETLQKGGKMGRMEFARIQREALESYLIDLIRAVVCAFFVLFFI